MKKTPLGNGYYPVERMLILSLYYGRERNQAKTSETRIEARLESIFLLLFQRENLLINK